MGIEQVLNEYNMRRCLRDSLSICKEEIAILEENEAVKRYLRLKNHYELYGHLEHKSDDAILDEIIMEDSQTLNEDIYFCYGKDFIGHPKKVGGYYIDQNQTSISRLHGIMVTKYRNIANPKDIVIIPSTEASEFELSHHVIYHNTEETEQEYYDIRRGRYRQEIRKLSALEIYDKPLYFCFGKYYRGIINEDGNYIISSGDSTNAPIILSYYRNIDDPDDIVIIPTEQCTEFEQDKNILYYQTINPENEYKALVEKRRTEEPVKRLVKEPKHE